MNRQQFIEDMKQPTFDLLVIGGGITGAGILLDARSRGLQVALIEKQDFAAGTSSRSTKLVHGGLRYLKQLQFQLVAEVGRERAIVYENAPHVTQPERMLLPLYKEGTFGKLSTSIGLKVYDFLAGVKKNERRSILNRTQTLEKEPLLQKSGLIGGGLYVEYKTDDARLTLEVIKEAVERGAKAANYVQAEDFIYQNKKIIGVAARDLLSNKTFSIFSKKVVNATGPWVDELRMQDGSRQGKRMFHSKGVHLVIDQSRFPLRQAVYFDLSDGRMMFAIPRERKVYIGTTDTPYSGDLMNPPILREDMEYILHGTNAMFPSLQLTHQDVEAAWSGIRPLIYEEGKTASEISRKDEIFHSSTGLITIAGGKLTGYRKMAEKVVDYIAKELGIRAPCTTARIPLSGGKFGGADQFHSFKEERIRIGQEIGLTLEEADALVRRYGSNVDCLYEILMREQKDFAALGLPKSVFAALRYGLEHEMVQKPIDFLLRRTSALLFDMEAAKRWKEPVTHYMKIYFGWTEQQAKSGLREIEQWMAETDPYKIR